MACTGPNPRFELRQVTPPADGPGSPDAGAEAGVPEVGPQEVGGDAGLDTGEADLGIQADTDPPADATPPDAATIDVPPPDAPLPDAPTPDAPVPVDVAPDTAPPVELVAGLVGYWRFDEADGARTMRDSSGRGNDGAFDGPSGGTAFITGKFGRAFELTAPDRDFGIRVDANAQIRGIQRYTLAAWALRRRNVPNEYCGIISRQIDGQDGEVFNLMVSKDLVKTYGPDRNSATGDVTTASVPTTPPLNEWFHVASTFDGSRIRIYYNGVYQDEAIWTAGLPSTGNAPVYLATKKVINWAHPYIGALDEVMLYDRALPPEAIAALARGERPPLP